MTSIFNYYLIVFNGALIGFMMFFVIVVSPVVFKTLSQDEAARFLRAVFPRLFLVGLFSSSAMVMLSLFGEERNLILISSVQTFFTSILRSLGNILSLNFVKNH